MQTLLGHDNIKRTRTRETVGSVACNVVCVFVDVDVWERWIGDDEWLW